MSKANSIIVPTRKEKFTLRLMIFLGLFSIAYFFYWFTNQDLIENQILFWLLMLSVAYDSLKVIYIWYHYWDISIPEKPVITTDLTADVFTTYFPGEPYDMIKETLLAIQKIKYPHTTYLCDEANDSYLRNFCKKNNILHVTRDNRINAKAGNINNALLQAKGDICLILDPDHIPEANLLDEVIPYFSDETIGFVQTVQAYYNIKESFVARGAAEQTFHFYGPVMMTMNSYGTVNAIGANCVFRRKALDSIGGHAAGLSEDMHTAMQLHARGWKSIYVPRIFTKGLVPASLTAYYKQQLKWSRGTLELLVVTYPKLFSKFSWRQKIHYGILPFHYLSGIIYLISFLVPIISLFTATTPWKGNVLNFGLIISPVFVCILGIRFYVQKWVMYKSERGIHIIGGLLQTCTWWIFIIGFIYTIIRKKVPYLPTPKEDKDRTSWKILIPNILVGIVSIFAVIYGLSIDYTPFSLFMSGFALLNAFFMFYTLYFAYERQKVVSLKFDLPDRNNSIVNRLQNFVFQFWRKSALPVIFLILIISAFVQNDIEYGKWRGVSPEVKNKRTINYLGVFAPQNDNGITNLKNVNKISARIDENFDIISIYLAWNKEMESNFPQSLIDSVYMQKSIPMITWEPWIDSFDEIRNKGKHVYELIDEGYFDIYIKTFALKLKSQHRPVFLRFAHEFDNPFYPWYVNDNEGALSFKKAWIHTYEIFKNNGAINVIWIWNPWRPDNIASFYPGKEYVDWIGVNILNYGQSNLDGKWHDFKDLYMPFHDEFKNLPSTPVIISEFGALKNDKTQNEWLQKAFVSMENEFEEIKSVIYFNSNVDNYLPQGLQVGKNLDWTIDKTQVIKNSFIGKEVPNYVLSPLPKLNLDESAILPLKKNKLKNVKGINLKKGHDWRRDYHVLSRMNLIADFERIKRLGINTIKFEGNSVYEYNILNIAKEFDLNVSYGFWISEDLDFVNDTIKTKLLKKSILKKVADQKKCSHIASWNIENDVQYNQKNFYHKPELLYQNSAYVIWLSDLAQEIKKIDSTRPLIVDLEVNQQSVNYARTIIDNIPEIDELGLVVKEDKYLDPLMGYLNNRKAEFLFSEIGVDNLITPKILNGELPFFITEWQDAHENNKLNFDGIIDRKGRYKLSYFKLLNALQKSNVKYESPVVRILKPSTVLYEGQIFDYYALCYDSINFWRYETGAKDLKFEWSLVKCDINGNYLAIKDIGTGARLSLKVPHDNETYRLLLSTTKGETTTTNITTLNTPIDEEMLNLQ